MRWLLVLLVVMGGCHAVLGYDDVEFLPQASKVDVLLVIDNSVGNIMTDKQEIFETAVDTLMEQLLARVDDLHVGIITTSLGSLGGDACAEESKNDHGRLVARKPDGMPVSTYQEMGFLKWDPQHRYDPPGLDDGVALRDQLGDMVRGTGQSGCPFEATLESFYRFLVDPDPYESIALEDGLAVLVGTDEQLLAQRRAFLRPDSLLIIVLLTDENDCSLRAGSQYWQVAQAFVNTEAFHLEPGRFACEIDPTHACCTSCALDPVEGCDPTADTQKCGVPLDETTDPLELRCYQQKRRFGIDFLQPIDRYVAGLTSPDVTDRSGQLRDNPLFTSNRHQWHVVVAAIVGVPWQDVARKNDLGNPDLLHGLDAQGQAVGGLQSAAELRNNGTWDLILGEPAAYFQQPDPRLPLDPLMRESIAPRDGTQPITGEPVGPSPLVNDINGHEHQFERDLQYACTIRLQEPKDCAVAETTGCNCTDPPPTESPMCQDPDSGTYGTKQFFAAAYPGIRHLELLRALGDQAVVGSICPAQGVNAAEPTGYQPTVGALLETIAPRITE